MLWVILKKVLGVLFGAFKTTTFVPDGAGSLTGCGFAEREVNDHDIQVLAVAHVRNVKVVSYEIVMAPPLPFSLGSSGAVVAGGKSLIGGVESSGVTADGLSSDELVDGGVVANGATLPASMSKALTLTGEVELVGKAKYNGSYEQGPQVNMSRGSLESISEPEELPQIDPKKYDPASTDNNWKHVTRSGTVDPATGAQVVTDKAPVFGFHRFDATQTPGGVRFDEPVVLNGGLIFVDGDVTLTKSLSGTGALVATGKVTITGGADIKADALAAVVAGGDLTVGGTRDTKGAISSKFTGLLYSGGNLTLQDTRTVGSAIAAGTASGGSVMTIQDSEFLASPEGQDVSIVIQDFADPEKIKDRNNRDNGESPIINPTTEAVVGHPDFQDLNLNDSKGLEDFINSLIRVRVGTTTYNFGQLPTNLSNDERSAIRIAHLEALTFWKSKIGKLKEQMTGQPIQTVRFDLNEFLNVSDRLKASRPYFIED